MCKKLLVRQLKNYQNYHTKFWTRLTHFIGVPLIIFSLITLTSWIHIRIPSFFDMPLSWLLSIIVLIYYCLLDITFAAVTAILFLIFNLIVSLTMKDCPSWISFQVFLYTFILGVMFQFIGHLIEKKKLAFMADIKQFLTAPIFLVAEVFFYFGLKLDLKQTPPETHL